MKINNVAGNLVRQQSYAKRFAWIHNNSMIIEIISSLLVLLFSYAAISKLMVYDTFIRQLSKSPFLENYAHTIAWMIPSAECIIALLLVIKRTRLIALFASFALMLAFTVYIFMMLHFSYYIPCSCGGVLAKMTWNQHFWFNVVFTLLALSGILLSVVKNNKS